MVGGVDRRTIWGRMKGISSLLCKCAKIFCTPLGLWITGNQIVRPVIGQIIRLSEMYHYPSLDLFFHHISSTWYIPPKIKATHPVLEPDGELWSLVGHQP
jgi:hypothetical protein